MKFKIYVNGKYKGEKIMPFSFNIDHTGGFFWKGGVYERYGTDRAKKIIYLR